MQSSINTLVCLWQKNTQAPCWQKAPCCWQQKRRWWAVLLFVLVCGRPASGLWSLACLVPRRESYYLLLESCLLHLHFVCVRPKSPAFYDDGRFRSSCMRHPPVAKSSKRRVHSRPSFVHSLAICSSVPSSNLKLPQSSARGTLEQPSWL